MFSYGMESHVLSSWRLSGQADSKTRPYLKVDYDSKVNLTPGMKIRER